MNAVYTLANNSIPKFYRLLKESNVLKTYTVKICLVGEPLFKSDILIVPTVTLFIRNLKNLQDRQSVVFVFDSPMMCLRLGKENMLDATPKPGYVFSFERLDINRLEKIIRKSLSENKKVNIKYKYDTPQDIISTLLRSTDSSIVQPILNFLYKIPDTKNRPVYQSVIYTWLSSNKDIVWLADYLNSKRKKPIKATDDLISFFHSPEGENGRQAIHELIRRRKAKQPISYSALSKQYGIPTFDLRYCMKTIIKSRKFQQDK